MKPSATGSESSGSGLLAFHALENDVKLRGTSHTELKLAPHKTCFDSGEAMPVNLEFFPCSAVPEA